MDIRKLPIRISDFPLIREERYLYVDKTAEIFDLVNSGYAYFLSRPRCFGKTLLCSTLEAYLEGRKELFAGLALENLEEKWTKHPVLRLDLSLAPCDSKEALKAFLENHLSRWEELYGSPRTDSTLSQRFWSVIERAHQHTGVRAAILIDDYDWPLLATLESRELHTELKSILDSFFYVLKSAGEHIKFLLMTGVTTFTPESVFSDLNHLFHISSHYKYDSLCGFIESELLENFAPELESLAQSRGEPNDVCVAELRRQMAGYHFHYPGHEIYNPFSTLHALKSLEIRNDWYGVAASFGSQTNMPMYIKGLLEKSSWDLLELDGIDLDEDSFVGYHEEFSFPIVMLYQCGYLAIKGKASRRGYYTIGFPNAEVRNSILNVLLPSKTQV